MKPVGLLLITLLLSLASFSQECPDSCVIYVPNNLTPDCEGSDCELLEVVSNCPFNNVHFIIFNRWGEIIFETADIRNKFDSYGYPQGTYSWKLNGETCNGKTKDLTGHFTIIH